MLALRDAREQTASSAQNIVRLTPQIIHFVSDQITRAFHPATEIDWTSMCSLEAIAALCDLMIRGPACSRALCWSKTNAAAETLLNSSGL